MVADGWSPKVASAPQKDISLHCLSVEKSGPAACRDHGARHATHDWLCFVDSDVLVHPGAFTKAVSILQASGDDGLVGSYDDKPENPSLVSRFRNLKHHFHHQKHAGETGVFWGAFSIVRKSAYLDVGGFDRSYRDASVEDIELGYRLADKGYRIVLRPEVQVKHLKQWTLMGMVRTDVYLRAKPWALLLHRLNRTHKVRLNLAIREKISAALCLSGMISLLLSAFWSFPPIVTILAFLIFIIIQRGFYSFMSDVFSIADMPRIFLLHQVYFLSALGGWLLARLEIIKTKG